MFKMTELFRHYYQVKITNQGNSQKPQVEGVEEVYCNGKKQVRHFNDLESLRSNEFEESWGELPSFFIDEVRDYLNFNQPRSYRYLNPEEVIIETDNHKKATRIGWGQQLSGFLSKISQKAKKWVKNLPLALKVAWQELNQ
jgi:hypothetical protein